MIIDVLIVGLDGSQRLEQVLVPDEMDEEMMQAELDAAAEMITN